MDVIGSSSIDNAGFSRAARAQVAPVPYRDAANVLARLIAMLVCLLATFPTDGMAGARASAFFARWGFRLRHALEYDGERPGLRTLGHDPCGSGVGSREQIISRQAAAKARRTRCLPT